MSKETLFVAISNQKGGVGKSALSVVLASYFHFEKGLNVAIVDCDSPQHSLVRMRERDKKAVSNSAYYRQLIKQQWSRVQKKAYPIVGSTAEKAREAADAIAAGGDYDLIFVDLPGTVESTGVFRTIVNMDYVLTPTVPDLIVMQSTLSFATTVLDHIKKMENTPLLKDIFFFWNKLKKRTNVEILRSYSEVMRELHLTVLDSTRFLTCAVMKRRLPMPSVPFSVARCCLLRPSKWKAAVWWNLRKSLWSNLNLDSHEKENRRGGRGCPEGNHCRRHTCFRQGQPRPERKARGTSGSEKSCRNRTGRCSSGKARRGEAQKEKG